MSSMEKEKYTKKASVRILKEVLKLNPKASGFTTLDQAFVMLMEQWDMELSVEKIKSKTSCVLYRDDDKVMTWDFDEVWNDKEGDWDWNTIYKVVLETIIKEKLYKRPKLGKRALAKLEKEKAAKKKADESPVETETPTPSIEELKRMRGTLSVRKSNWKKQGKDVSSIEEEICKLNEQIKLLK